MLLNKFKTPVAPTLCSESSDGFVVRKARSLGRSESLQVRASASAEGTGWLDSASTEGTGWLDSASTKFGKVASFVERKLEEVREEFTHEVVEYFGTAVIMKKLQMLEIIDRVADIQDDTSELVGGKRVTVQLISTNIDPHTGKAMMSNKEIFPGWPALEGMAIQNVVFQLRFTVSKTFGVPGAIIVHNGHPNEFLLISFNLELPDRSTAHYVTESWVYNTEKTDGRIFFRNKAYLPTETPAALKELREKELQALRGDGTGERQPSDRIYDYDVYNDLGSPDDDPKLERPNLGGNKEYPFPRRIRTGRARSKFNPKYETRKTKRPFYIPRDECFERTKMGDFMADGVRSIVHSATSKISLQLRRKSEFDSIEEIKKLYRVKGKKVGRINNVLPDKTNVPARNQQSLVFLNEVLRPDGQPVDPLLYPLPRILQGSFYFPY
jgi:lipoxygenase